MSLDKFSRRQEHFTSNGVPSLQNGQEFFVDAGNAWGPDVSPSGFPNARRIRPRLTSVGAEVTTEVLGLYNVELRLRTGVAVPLGEGRGARVYLRIGLPF